MLTLHNEGHSRRVADAVPALPFPFPGTPAWLPTVSTHISFPQDFLSAWLGRPVRQAGSAEGLMPLGKNLQPIINGRQ